jgi:hypothetical protein
MPTNDERVKAASGALYAYRAHKGELRPSEVNQSDITALLTDLRHYCREHGLCFEDANSISRYHFMEERGKS